jgi:hypothetical protein
MTSLSSPSAPLTPQQPSNNARKNNSSFNRQIKVTLPTAAINDLKQICQTAGISMPGLLLAMVRIGQGYPPDQLRAQVEQAALRYRHFATLETEDGSRVRVRAGYYNRAGTR